MFTRRSIRVPWLRVTGAAMRNASVGRLPENLAEGNGSPQPAPEYIAEAATPSEDALAREQARYRAKNQTAAIDGEGRSARPGGAGSAALIVTEHELASAKMGAG